MGRPKGGHNKNWSQEEKLRIVKRHCEEGISQRTLAKEENISTGQLCNWVKKYQEEGPEGLKSKKKTGNKFTALSRSKNLSEIERLRLLVMKQEIEIERLKKGYYVKGVGADKAFVILKGKNMK